MSFVVMGMEMPESCAKCRLKYWTNAGPYCPIIKSSLEWNQFSTGEWAGVDKRCPLGELPEKHGRLIDADGLKETLDYYIREAGWGEKTNRVLGWVKDEFIDAETTIVEAEV